MNQKEPNKTIMMNSDWQKPFDLNVFRKKCQFFKVKVTLKFLKS